MPISSLDSVAASYQTWKANQQPADTSTSLNDQEQQILQEIESDPSKAEQLLSKLPPSERAKILNALKKANPAAYEQVIQNLPKMGQDPACADGLTKPSQSSRQLPQTGAILNWSA